MMNAQVWVYAAAQVFNSIGIAFGSMIAFASYNPFHGKIFRYSCLNLKINIRRTTFLTLWPLKILLVCLTVTVIKGWLRFETFWTTSPLFQHSATFLRRNTVNTEYIVSIQVNVFKNFRIRRICRKNDFKTESCSLLVFKI
jgi:hypothetical protein